MNSIGAPKMEASAIQSQANGWHWAEFQAQEILFWLVVTGCHFLDFPINIGFLIIPIDALIFFRGVALAHQPVLECRWIFSLEVALRLTIKHRLSPARISHQ